MGTYGLTKQDFDPNVLKDLKNIDQKLTEEKNPEEVMKLRMAKLYRGMQLNALGYNPRNIIPY